MSRVPKGTLNYVFECLTLVNATEKTIFLMSCPAARGLSHLEREWKLYAINKVVRDVFSVKMTQDEP